MTSYKDYRDDGERKQEHLPGVTFLGTFLQHILPPGIHNKRRYGFWGYNVRTETLTLIRAQLGMPPVVHEHVENTDDGNMEARQAPGEPRPRHCAICKEELDYVGGTPRPSPCTVWHMIWDEMVAAIDVRPESCRVRTWEERRRGRAAVGGSHSKWSCQRTSDVLMRGTAMGRVVVRPCPAPDSCPGLSPVARWRRTWNEAWIAPLKRHGQSMRIV